MARITSAGQDGASRSEISGIRTTSAQFGHLVHYAASPLDTGHQQAKFFFVGFGGQALAHDLAVEHHRDPVGERQDLVQLDGDQQDRLALIAQGDDLLVDEFDRADIDAARRLADQQQVGVALDLAGQHDFLLVAARKILGRQASGWAGARRSAPSCARDRPSDGGVVHQAAVLLVLRVVVIAEGHVFPGLEIHDQTFALAVLGHMGDAAGAPASGRRNARRSGRSAGR